MDRAVEADHMVQRPGLVDEAGQAFELVRACEEHARPTVAKHEANLVGGQHDVDRVHYGRGLQSAVVGDDPLPPVRRVQRHTVAGDDTTVDESRSDPVRQLVELCVGEAAGRRDQRDLVGTARGRQGQDLAGSVEELSHAGASSWRVAASAPGGSRRVIDILVIVRVGRGTRHPHLEGPAIAVTSGSRGLERDLQPRHGPAVVAVADIEPPT